MGVELGSDAALFPGVESRLGNRGCNTATARADAGDVNLFLVDILQFKYKVGRTKRNEEGYVRKITEELLSKSLSGFNGNRTPKTRTNH